MARLDDRVRRAEGALQLARAAAVQDCPCGRPDWRIEGTRGRTRYARCRTCGRKTKIVAD